MVERAIRLRSSAVRAILAGTQTVVRQPMKPQPDFAQVYEWRGRTLYDGEHRRWFYRGHDLGDVCCNQPEFSEALVPLGPYGAPGDRLWVQETWCAADTMYYGHDADPPRVIGYRADLSANSYESNTDRPRAIPASDLASWGWDTLTWRSSTQMPRWASRLSLDVVSVRVERLDAITPEDARREGFKTHPHNPEDGPMFAPEVLSFMEAWGRFNGAQAPWSSNPWVWRIEFSKADALAISPKEAPNAG